MDRNGAGSAHENWDAQREQISAYVDGELSAAETRALEAHLAGCAACQQELAELRQLRALLRALPAPLAPRSFTLPETGPVPIPLSVPTATSASASRQTRAAPNRKPVVARAVQWAGGVAAAAGLAIVLGSAIAGLGGTHSFASTSSGAAASGAHQAPAAASSTGAGGASRGTGPQGASVEPRDTTATTGNTLPAATPQPTGSYSSKEPVASPQQGGGAPIGPLSGAGLIIGGGVLLVGGRAAERRRQRQGHA